MKIQIIKWEKYQPRKDLQMTRWFRMDHMFFFDFEMRQTFTRTDMIIWVSLLAYASMKNKNGKIYACVAAICDATRANENEVNSALEKLEQEQMITITRDADVTPTLRERDADVTLQDKTRQDTTRQEKKNLVRSDFIAPEPTVKKIEFNFETMKFENIIPDYIAKWKDAYPAVDVEGQIKRAEVWLASNPAKRKKNYAAFLSRWFSRDQERGGSIKANSVSEIDKNFIFGGES